MILNKNDFKYVHLTPELNKNWRIGVWKKNDFKKIKNILKKYKENIINIYTAENYGFYNSQRVVLVHLRINPKKSYEEVQNMIKEMDHIHFKAVQGCDYCVPMKMDKYKLDSIEHYTGLKFNKEYDILYCFANGDFDTLLSHLDFYNIKKSKVKL